MSNEFEQLEAFAKQSLSFDFVLNPLDSSLGKRTREEEIEVSVSTLRKKSKKTYWSEIEEVFLSGIALTCFASRHSLKEAKSTTKESKKPNKVSAAWSAIHEVYETARKRYNQIYGENLPARTPHAINKKWKDSGNRDLNIKHVFASIPRSVLYLERFSRVYNRNQILTCSESRFEQLIKNGLS